MKIYTRSGDDGTTGLYGGPRVSKANLRIAAYGSIDELNAALGVARTAGLTADVDEIAARMQHALFALGAELASPDAGAAGTVMLEEWSVTHLEKRIDEFEQRLPPLKTFILPGGCVQAAALHSARCICRRAEREMVALAASEAVRGTLLKYVNRVSDLLFVIARVENAAREIPDVPWDRSQI
ncbi:MAG: cob(I)yrinic acid a,c-diamide adenosyltransferase [Planctomycetales bacterium]|nr:cob(I)yrinic acid a,c-diamide adenosyltransferase [Planctomycetales bacterium]